MPVCDGITAAKGIRGSSSNPNRDTPMIALTANVSDTDRADIEEVGMKGLLSKYVVGLSLFLFFSLSLTL